MEPFILYRLPYYQFKIIYRFYRLAFFKKQIGANNCYEDAGVARLKIPASKFFPSRCGQIDLSGYDRLSLIRT